MKSPFFFPPKYFKVDTEEIHNPEMSMDTNKQKSLKEILFSLAKELRNGQTGWTEILIDNTHPTPAIYNWKKGEKKKKKRSDLAISVNKGQM